jgi:hypothetical protein
MDKHQPVLPLPEVFAKMITQLQAKIYILLATITWAILLVMVLIDEGAL